VKGPQCDPECGAHSYLVTALFPGYRVYDPLSGTLVQWVSAGPNAATVNVSLNVAAPAADTAAPSAPVLAGVRGGTKGQPTETLSWPAAVDDVAVTAYRVYVNGASYTDVFADQTAFVFYLPKRGVTSFCVAARDQAGNESGCSNTVSG
jgi:hypothetical protein